MKIGSKCGRFPFWKAVGFALAAVSLQGTNVCAQLAVTNTPIGTNISTSAANDSRSWAFNLSVMGYLVPEGRDYAQPTLTADRDWLHLEARYNYENYDTGSLWFGYNLSGQINLRPRGETNAFSTVEWQLTPMAGGVFGHMNGVAPGYTLNLNWWKVSLYSQGEYVFDAGDWSESFFYSWSELSIAPMNWWRIGLVAQRTKVYQTSADIQRGLLAGVTVGDVSFTAYFFNLDQRQQTYVLSLGWSF